MPARQATQPGEIGSLESILGILNSLKILALFDVPASQATYAGAELIPVILKRSQIQAPVLHYTAFRLFNKPRRNPDTC